MNYKRFITAYINHLQKGFSEKSFAPCDYLELEEFAKKENLMDKINQAKRDSQKYWESFAIKALSDNWEHFKYELWIFIMKSRFGWSDAPKDDLFDTDKVLDVQLKLNNDLDIPDSRNS